MTDPEAFLVCDLRGAAAFGRSHGEGAAADLRDAYQALVRGAIEAAGGATARTDGDAFYVTFDSAGAAVRCGLAIVQAATEATAETPVRPIRVAVGIHAGAPADAEDEAGSVDREGEAGSAEAKATPTARFDIAAHVCAEAFAGDVLITQTVRPLVPASLEVTIRSRGRSRLEGLAEPIELFAVYPPGGLVAPRPAGVLGIGPLAGAGPIWTAVLAVVALGSLLVPLAFVIAQVTGNGPTATPGGGSASPTPTVTAPATPAATGTGPTSLKIVDNRVDRTRAGTVDKPNTPDRGLSTEGSMLWARPRTARPSSA